MSQCLVFTNDTITETWTGGNNKSDSWASVEIDGGSVTRELGTPSSEVQVTKTYTSNGTAVNVHVGAWVTPACPEAITIPIDASFGFNHSTCWESAGQLNAYLFYKVSVATESGGVLTYNRTLVAWRGVYSDGALREMGLVSGSDYSMGGLSTKGVNTHSHLTSADSLAVGERLVIEVGFQTAGRNNDTINFEHGSTSHNDDDDTILAGQIGAGSYGSCVVVPINFSEANQTAWSAHPEVEIPWLPGTDLISWADIGGDWTSAKWETNAAKKYVNRLGGIIRATMWIFQDDDYLYVAMNNIDDTCIQNSDHHMLFLCAGADWSDSLETDQHDWLFIRDITSGGSDSRAPTLPVAALDGNSQGEYVLQGDAVATYPENWEIPTYTGTPHTCTFGNSKAWVDGVDWRAKGVGATATAPNPNGNSQGAYSEFKIKKSSLNNWNGTDHLGFMAIFQCDVQGNGHTVIPSYLGSQVDKKDWAWAGADYDSGDGKTAAAQSNADEMDFRPIMAIHAHALSAPATRNRAIITG